jgi:hypothetical protein
MLGGETSCGERADVLRAAFAHTGMSQQQIHVEHFAVGGPLIPTRLQEILTGDGTPTRNEFNSIAMALNSVFVDQGLGHVVPYYDDLSVDGDGSP